MNPDNVVIAVATAATAGIIIGTTLGLLFAWSQSRMFRAAREQARLATILSLSTKREY